MENTIVEQLRKELAKNAQIKEWKKSALIERKADGHQSLHKYEEEIARLDRWEADARALLEAWAAQRRKPLQIQIGPCGYHQFMNHLADYLGQTFLALPSVMTVNVTENNLWINGACVRPDDPYELRQLFYKCDDLVVLVRMPEPAKEGE
jgi:hypothetical protein